MSVDEVKGFYNFIFENKAIQSKLIDTQGIDQFVSVSTELAVQNGFTFSQEEMLSTMSSLGKTKAFEDVNFEDAWVKKIMEIGWVPLGYSK